MNQVDDELQYWLAFDQLSMIKLGSKRILNLYQHFDNLKTAWSADWQDLMEVPGMTREIVAALLAKRGQVDPPALLEELNKKQIKAYPVSHPVYPAQLSQIHSPPAVVYVKGELSASEWEKAIGVVGTRRPTSYGQKVAKDFARAFAANGATVVSGMAIGIDSLAHRGALDGGGRTIAVLGCGVDFCYPSSNRPLYRLLTEEGHGAVLSEYPPGITPEPWRFPARNRIIAGLVSALVVVEAGEESGSLITAQLAFEENRLVFAVPGQIDRPMSAGVNWLMAKDKAHCAPSWKYVLDELDWGEKRSKASESPPVELLGPEKDIYRLICHEPMNFDLLCERTGLSAAELSASLTMMELSGVLTRHPGDLYSKGDTEGILD